MGEGGEQAQHHGYLPSLPVLWAPDLGQALGVAIGVSHGPPELHWQLVRADQFQQLLLPVACGDKSGALWGSQGLNRGQWGQAQGRPVPYDSLPLPPTYSQCLQDRSQEDLGPKCLCDQFLPLQPWYPPLSIQVLAHEASFFFFGHAT